MGETQAEREDQLKEELEKWRQRCRRLRNEHCMDDRIHALEFEKSRLEREVKASHASLKGVAKERSHALGLIEKERVAAADAKRIAERLEDEVRVLQDRVRQLEGLDSPSDNLSVPSVASGQKARGKHHRYPATFTPRPRTPGTPGAHSRQSSCGSRSSSKGPKSAQNRPPVPTPRRDSPRQASENGTLRVASLLTGAAHSSELSERLRSTDGGAPRQARCSAKSPCSSTFSVDQHLAL